MGRGDARGNEKEISGELKKKIKMIMKEQRMGIRNEIEELKKNI